MKKNKTHRPRGSISDYLGLSTEQLSKLSQSELRGLVRKLNDAANKRLKRLGESGFGELSTGYRSRMWSEGRGKFKLTGKETMSRLKAAYLSVSNFLKPESRTTMKTIAEMEVDSMTSIQSAVLGTDLRDPDLYDRRYKHKKVLKKKTRKKLREFWSKYDQWLELQKSKSGKPMVTTNLDNVSTFEEEVYSQGLTSISSMEALIKAKYEQEQKEQGNESDTISASQLNNPSETASKPNKHKGKGDLYRNVK